MLFGIYSSSLEPSSSPSSSTYIIFENGIIIYTCLFLVFICLDDFNLETNRKKT